MRPKRSSTPSTNAGNGVPVAHVTGEPDTSAPVVAAISSATSSHRSCLRLLTTTDAPASARPSAIARPMPLVEPVTTTTLPVRSNSSAVSHVVTAEWITGPGEALLDVAAHEPGPQPASRSSRAGPYSSIGSALPSKCG